jgi:tetratricopeptide (TPR) repeat protein
MNSNDCKDADGYSDSFTRKVDVIELPVAELMPYAIQMHREGRLEDAQKCYEALLQVDANNANALHFLGVLKSQRNHHTEAIALIRRSLEMDSGVASWHNNLGNVLLGQGEFEAAAQSYRQCSDIDSSNVEVLNNLGVCIESWGSLMRRKLCCAKQYCWRLS